MGETNPTPLENPGRVPDEGERIDHGLAANDGASRLQQDHNDLKRALVATREELHQARQALQESRTRYFDLYDLAPVGYLTLDDKDTILESNLAVATMLGGTRQAIRQHPFTRYIVASDQGIFELHRRRLFESGEMQQLELRLHRIDDGEFWARLDASLAFDAQSNQPLFLLTIIDIDGAKQQAEAMKLNTIIVNKASDAIFTTTAGPDFIITSWNPGAESIYGWTAVEAIGRSALILQSDYPGRDLGQARQGILDAGEYSGAVMQMTKRGAHVHIDSRIVALRDDLGEISGWLCVNRDVTEQREAEAALRQSQHNLAQAQRIGRMGSWDWDLQQSTLYWSDELYRIFGVPAGFALTYASIEAMIHPDDRAMNNAAVQEVLKSGRPTDFQFRMIRPDGAIRQIEQHIVVEPAGDGTPGRLVGIMRDVTEEVRANNERHALRERLAEAERLEMVGRLAGGIAHDFNDKLASILVRAEIGQATVKPDTPTYHHFAEISRSANRSSALVRQLLAYAGRQKTEPHTLALNATVEGVLTLLRELLGGDVTLLFHGGAGLWPVYADPSQIEQLLVNLCINAHDAIGQDGRVSIATANVETEREIWSTGFVIAPGDYVVLSVTDNGSGMASDVLDHIFEPYYTTKPVGKGTGLGLATVYGIVKQNGGEIQVYSEPGIGSTFNIYLPRFRPEGTLPAHDAGQSLARGNGERILLVEDKHDMLHSTADALRHLGYTVTECSSPLEAERLVADGSLDIDLLLTDIVMPQMNGRDLATRVVALRPDTKCLFVSGYPAEFIADRIMPLEEHHFLHKPFSLAALAAKIRTALAR